ncbi:ABC transporter permease [Agromyces aerolatus]|uniref:ABC transporter permease n=1 Tax=Agromyces sp. LY-1074 TaxID=3074080 RepID=UPI002865FD8F|nr:MULTISPECIES: ABC transporter permease [unclassified Agromyces]MDR5700944.1 ABC transporter permease [Agromyces sp. LY-1074]MDR5707395.1 ABC transporter permease [Agromyces sp. LY-1358]
MKPLRGEVIRLCSTRLPLWALLAAVGAGAGLTGLLALIGPEHSTPPMPGIQEPEGVGLVIGLSGLLLFIPALIGTIAITSEYRHRTIGTTFLVVPRRGRVLTAKLVVYSVFGVIYGIVSSVASGLALVGAAALRGVPLGIGFSDLATMLAQLALAAAVYMVLGVAIGALARNQLLAIGIVAGYFYFLEHVLMIIPGLNVIYPYLPGGATASLTDFTFLTDTIAEQTPLTAAAILPPLLGAVVLAGYALIASTVAVLAPLRRDLG